VFASSVRYENWGAMLISSQGKKCKFSHDLSVERKTLKKNLYEDGRDEGADGEGKKEDGMDNWDEEKLRSVVLSKHGNPKTTTDKVCKFFIEAVENGKYGWFWQCAYFLFALTWEHITTINKNLLQVQTEVMTVNISTLYRLASF
jgi:hypothetical protein